MRSLREWDPATVGDYELVGLLGAGGMGEVFLARDRDGQPVAVKVVHTAFARDAEFRARFAREVAAAKRVRGPWTAAVIDADPEAPRPWLATEYVSGPSLAAAVSGHGPLPERTVGLLAGRLAQALAAIHSAGLVHRDLTPSNVLLGADGPRVIDFGIARATDATKLTLTGQAIGTPAYMAPEQLTEGTVGPPADVFTLGSLLYFAATGHGPFDDTSMVATLRRVAAADPDLSPVPAGLRGLVGRCLAASPAARPTAEGLVAELLHETASPPDGAWLPPAVVMLVQEHQDRAGAPTLIERPPPAATPAGRPVRRPSRLVLGGIVLVVLAVLVTLATVVGRPATQEPPVVAAPSTSASPTRSAAPSTVPLQRVALAPPVIPGWVAAVSPQRNVAYDAPPSWNVSSPGGVKGFDDGRGTSALMSGIAELGAGYCAADRDRPRAFAGVSGSTTARPADAAKETARLWARRYSATDGRDASARISSSAAVTVRGVAAVHVTATVVVPVEGPCDPPRAVIHTVALPGDDGRTVVWVLLADQGVDGVAAESDIARMFGTLRRAGLPECTATGRVPGTWC